MSIEQRLADFINLLLEETLTSIQTNHVEQAERMLELSQIAEGDVKNLVSEIGEDEIDAALDAKLFDTKSRALVALNLAQERQSAIKLMVDQGMPNMMVTSGEINASAEFAISDESAVQTAQLKSAIDINDDAKIKEAMETMAEVDKEAALKDRKDERGAPDKIRTNAASMSMRVLNKVPLRDSHRIGVNVKPNSVKNASGNADFSIKLNFAVNYD